MSSMKEALKKRMDEKYAVKGKPAPEMHPGKALLAAIEKKDHHGIVSAMKDCAGYEPDGDGK